MQYNSVTYKAIYNESKILKPNFHLNYGKLRIMNLKKADVPISLIGHLVNNIYTGGIFKRVFVEKSENGIPYISGQHLLHSFPLDSSKLISKKYTPRQQDMILKEDQLLVSCAGTVGNVRLINMDLDGVIGSQDIIRIIADESKCPLGYIYTYLSTPTAFNYIQSFIYGSVVPRIEPITLSKLPVPIFSIDIQNKIHDLIIESAKLRNEGNNLIRKLRNDIEKSVLENIKTNSKIKFGVTSLKEINCYEKRFDSPYNIDTGRIICDSIKLKDHVLLSSISQIFHPMLFGKKQLKGSPINGNALYKSSSMIQIKPETDFWLSKKKADLYEKLKVKEGWVLVSRTGTVGNVIRISKMTNNMYIDDHMIRILPQENYSGLIYIFLMTSFGQKMINFQKYGSVQDVINSEYISRIPIPQFLIQSDFLINIDKQVNEAQRKIDNSITLENEAISLLENEIEQWQH